MERSVCESVVQNDGSSDPEQWRIRTGSGPQLKVWNHDQFCLCGKVAIKSDATAAIVMVHRLGLGKSPTSCCWRRVGATLCSFRDNSSFQNVRTGESERCANQVSRAGSTVAPHENV